MQPWTPWLPFFKNPLSGDVTQDISPVTSWFSPQLEMNFAGDKQIEAQIISNVASYGKQLGLITEAIIELAGDSDGPATSRLKDLVSEIETLKCRHSSNSYDKIKSELVELKKNDKAKFERLMSELDQGD